MTPNEQHLARWCLILGEPAQEGCGASLSVEQMRMDKALSAYTMPMTVGVAVWGHLRLKLARG